MMKRCLGAALALACLAGAAAMHAQSWAWDDGSVPFVPTPEEVVDRMLRIAQLGKDDFLVDLGSGDGRIVIEAARRGVRALGVEYDASLVARASSCATSSTPTSPARASSRCTSCRNST